MHEYFCVIMVSLSDSACFFFAASVEDGNFELVWTTSGPQSR